MPHTIGVGPTSARPPMATAASVIENAVVMSSPQITGTTYACRRRMYPRPAIRSYPAITTMATAPETVAATTSPHRARTTPAAGETFSSP